jgi:hypothetical protein
MARGMRPWSSAVPSIVCVLPARGEGARGSSGRCSIGLCLGSGQTDTPRELGVLWTGARAETTYPSEGHTEHRPTPKAPVGPNPRPLNKQSACRTKP